MAKELEALRNQREDNGLKSTVSPDTQFDSPEYTLEQSGTAVLMEFGLKGQYELGACVLDRNTVVEIFKMLGMHVGVSPSINETIELATIENFIRTYPISPEFAYHVMVHHTLAKFTTVVLENSQEVVSQSLVKLFDTELDSLRTKFPAPWSPRLEMAVLVAKLHLYTMTIIRMQLDLTSREILMKNGYSVALRIVYLSDQGLFYRSSDYPDLPAELLQRSCPKNYFRALVLATVFLLRFFALNVNASPEEQEAAKNHIAIAQRFFKAGSKDPSDEKNRAAMLLEILSRQEPMDIDNTKLRIDDRMGASLVFDAITKGHELRNIKADVEERTSPHENGVDEQQMSAEMAPQPIMPAFNDYSEMTQVDMNPTGDYEIPLDFALPQDLWGDSVWGMFGTFAPQY
ncbi:hypothetical protein N0V90_001905 [Kalmusia sp. IMI 367209]|nr:hypothetical protein N0V90_001905 [Kalmusia sp. IMI 367209]